MDENQEQEKPVENEYWISFNTGKQHKLYGQEFGPNNLVRITAQNRFHAEEIANGLFGVNRFQDVHITQPSDANYTIVEIPAAEYERIKALAKINPKNDVEVKSEIRVKPVVPAPPVEDNKAEKVDDKNSRGGTIGNGLGALSTKK